MYGVYMHCSVNRTYRDTGEAAGSGSGHVRVCVCVRMIFFKCRNNQCHCGCTWYRDRGDPFPRGRDEDNQPSVFKMKL